MLDHQYRNMVARWAAKLIRNRRCTCYRNLLPTGA